MKLLVKLNVALILFLLLALSAVAYLSRELLQQQARDEVMQRAKIMMEVALASRTYTVTQIAPLLETQMKYQFLPQSVPAYGATEQLNELTKKFPDYTYKEATLNPTNLRDRASDWEADIVNVFRQAPDRKEIVGERETPTGRAIYVARPLQIKNEACLACHSTAEAAPKTMTDIYGTANGFGWKLNEIIGAQVVSIQANTALKRADATFNELVMALGAMALFLWGAFNLVLYFMVIRPMPRSS